MPDAKPRPAKLFYTIGEAAAMLNVNASLIRYWEKEFKNVKPRKTRRGNRLFTMEDIEQLRFLHHLIKEQGHTLDGARRIIAKKNGEDASRFQILNTLEEIKSFLLKVRDEL
jgi:DNA-binding transcriptional MerR regulator